MLAVRHTRAEEESARAEAILGTATSRCGWALSHIGLALRGVAGQVPWMAVAAALHIPAAVVLVTVGVERFARRDLLCA